MKIFLLVILSWTLTISCSKSESAPNSDKVVGHFEGTLRVDYDSTPMDVIVTRNGSNKYKFYFVDVPSAVFSFNYENAYGELVYYEIPLQEVDGETFKGNRGIGFGYDVMYVIRDELLFISMDDVDADMSLSFEGKKR